MNSGGFQSVRSWFSEQLDQARLRLALPGALMSLSVLGLITGSIAGAVIVAFRLLVEGSQEFVLPGQGPENFEALTPEWRFLLPVLAAVLLIGMFRWLGKGIHVLGVAHVLERMDRHQGRISFRAFLLQFAGAALAIVGGHSVGREGPNVFLGAASGSLLAKRLELPNNVVRTLVGCGTAAGIAASFNTPLAGVIFALEVIMLEYSVRSFIPVILAAVSATAVSSLVFGSHPAFTLPAVQIGSLWDLLPVIALGIAAGAVSATWIQTVETITRRTMDWSIGRRLLIAGVLMGGFGTMIPGTMGIGYDSVDAALRGGLATSALILLLAGKLLASSICVGLGIPGGSIGPTLFMGAMLGGLFGVLAGIMPLVSIDQVGLFALLGMGAMMAGSLQAPLAALTAMLELTDNPNIILPGMLVVVISGLTAGEVFGKDSLFLTLMRAGGVKMRNDPIVQALRRMGVAGVMERSIAQVGQHLSRERAENILRARPRFLLIGLDNESQVLMPSTHLAGYLESGEDSPVHDPINLLSIPAVRWQVAPIGLQANLQEASEALGKPTIEALVVRRHLASGNQRVYGVLTPEMVESAYRS